MQYNPSIIITTGSSRKSTHWQAQTLHWSDFVARLATPQRTGETYQSYLQMPKGEQDALKDVGGFVGGTLLGLRRKTEAVQTRSIITLDADNIPAGEAQKIINTVEGFGCAYAIYSTRKHCGGNPRLRILFPLDTPCTADEYEPIARRMAAHVGMPYFDPTTFEASRLMYWPSASADSEYLFTYGDKPWLSGSGILATYTDWRDVTTWPEVPGVAALHLRAARRQGDPTEKTGTVGVFCRCYDIPAAIDQFLSGIYEPTIDGRYTFVGGSTAGGAVLYDSGSFLYSHHATDPCSGKLVNSFDLVRLHLFAALDDDAKPDTPPSQLPSYKAMQQRAVADKAVATMLAKERVAHVQAAFGAPLELGGIDWMEQLTVDSKGKTKKTTDNVLLLLEHDPLLAGCASLDELTGRYMITRDTPWRKIGDNPFWDDTDDAGLRHYLETGYELSGKDRIHDAFALCAARHSKHEIKEYLNTLHWDGVLRLDSIIIDYLGAEDNVYTRAATRKFFAAATGRILHPGIKFDYMPILAGLQGIGKSTFFRIMGGKWHNDSVQKLEGKEAAEIIQTAWIVELGELAGLNRAEVNDIKQFLSRTEDVFRAAYGRHAKTYPRHCVFCGTTNDTNYLRDHTGARRFWPIDLGVQEPSKDVFTELAQERDQLWAEALYYWNTKEPLYLQGEAAAFASGEQERHREVNPKEGIVREFLEQPIPHDWTGWSMDKRRMFWAMPPKDVLLIPRDRICAAEVWCECFKKDIGLIQRKDVMEINQILTTLGGLERDKTSAKYGEPYGLQRGFRAGRRCSQV